MARRGKEVTNLLVALDPGIRGCGVASFIDGHLSRAAYVKNPARRGCGAAECVAMARAVEAWYDGEADELACEWPQIYAKTQGKDPNDLLALCGIDTAVSCCVAPNGLTTTYKPAAWKGQMPKGACHQRIATRLNSIEFQIALKAAAAIGDLAHNMWDAVGIGLHHLGRLKPERIITP